VTGSVVHFPIGEDGYAVAARIVREVVVDARPTRLPTVTPGLLLGMFNLRGEVLPMFDVAALLGIGSLADAAFAVVVTTASGPAGLVVGGLPRVIGLGDQVAAAELPGTVGVHRVEGGLAVLLDVEELLLVGGGLDAAPSAEALAAR
jgi:chemotaxis signal transduction protein